MPAPRVFVSSTCYDLKDVRKNLRNFIRGIGYEPIISEEGNVFFDPRESVEDACLDDISNHQLFVLIIGGRYGSQYKNTEKSITNAEYQEAVKHKIRIFALVDRGVYDQYRVYRSNKENPDIDHEKIMYPDADDTRIFNFIEEVQAQAVNNALVPFSDYEELEKYLKQQWAGMMYRFIDERSEAKRTGDFLSALSATTDKIEYYTRQVASIVGDEKTKVGITLNDVLYDTVAGREITSRLKIWGFRPTVRFFHDHESFDEAVGTKLRNWEGEQDKYYLPQKGGKHFFDSGALEVYRRWYKETRNAILEQMDKMDEEILKYLDEDMR